MPCIRWAWLILSEAHEGLVKAKTEEIEAGKKQLEVWWVLVSKIQASNSWKDGFLEEGLQIMDAVLQ